MNRESSKISRIIGVLVLSGTLTGCGALSTRPTNDEAIKQMTSYIQQCPSSERLGGWWPLSTNVQLVNLKLIDTRQIDSSTVEIVFLAEYKALREFDSVFMGQAQSVLSPGNHKKGDTFSVTGITTRFQRYEQRGWVLAHVGQ